MTKGNFIKRFRCFEIILSAGKVNRLVTHKLVDQKIKKERQNVIFEPIGLIDFISPLITLQGLECHIVRCSSWAPVGALMSVTYLFLKKEKEEGR